MQRLTVNIYLCTLFRLYPWKYVKTNSQRYEINPTANLEYRTKNEVLYYKNSPVYAVCLHTFPHCSPSHWTTRKVRDKFV
jgi:hypothetical protein